jgi:hypothetical protein
MSAFGRPRHHPDVGLSKLTLLLLSVLGHRTGRLEYCGDAVFDVTLLSSEDLSAL